VAEQNHWSERGRATSVVNADAHGGSDRQGHTPRFDGSNLKGDCVQWLASPPVNAEALRDFGPTQKADDELLGLLCLMASGSLVCGALGTLRAPDLSFQ